MNAAMRSLTSLDQAPLELAAAEVAFLQSDVVVDRLGNELGARLLDGVGHLHVHRGPDTLDLLEPPDGVDLLLLVPLVEDVRLDDDVGVLEHERDNARELGGGVLAARFEPPRRLRASGP